MIKLKSILLEIDNDSDLDALAYKFGYTIKDIYHGTSEKFYSFKHDIPKNVIANDNNNVIYATDSKEEARSAGNPKRSNSIVMKLYGKMETPFIIDAKGTEKNRSFGEIGYQKLIKIAKSKGCDGAIIKNVIDFGDVPQTTYIFFNNRNVKLSGVTIDNTGVSIPLEKRFDSSNADLRY